MSVTFPNPKPGVNATYEIYPVSTGHYHWAQITWSDGSQSEPFFMNPSSGLGYIHKRTYNKPAGTVTVVFSHSPTGLPGTWSAPLNQSFFTTSGGVHAWAETDGTTDNNDANVLIM